jgi:hypothetical protein
MLEPQKTLQLCLQDRYLLLDDHLRVSAFLGHPPDFGLVCFLLVHQQLVSLGEF